MAAAAAGRDVDVSPKLHTILYADEAAAAKFGARQIENEVQLMQSTTPREIEIFSRLTCTAKQGGLCGPVVTRPNVLQEIPDQFLAGAEKNRNIIVDSRAPEESCINFACTLAPPGKYGERLRQVAISGSATRGSNAAVARLLWYFLFNTTKHKRVFLQT